MKNHPIKTFNSWAKKNKDVGMEKNHAHSVDFMLQKIPTRILNSEFSFLDIGCGNGWVVRKMRTQSNCCHSAGIDGAENMINKAMSLDSKSDYFKLDLDNLDFTQQFDVVFSMEVFYYLKDILRTLKYIYQHILKENGFFVLGVDHYLENKASLSWGKDLSLDLKTLSINDWVCMFESVGFSNIRHAQFGAKDNWAGTLVIYATK